MPQNVRCDLAVEAREMLTEMQGTRHEIPGVSMESEDIDGLIHITRVHVTSKEGADALLKEPGRYITAEMPARFYGQQEIYETMCRVCAKELQSITRRYLTDENDSVLVIGLGNWNITADALGPKVIHSLMITRHLKEYIPDEIDEGIRPVSAIAPGVLGLTGVETGEVICGVLDRVCPAAVIAVDALAAGRLSRLLRTVQLADTGITPGAGVGNARAALNEETLGVPVIAVGVPTVVDGATLAHEISSQLGQPACEALDDLSQPVMITTRDIDREVADISRMIGYAVNMALHPHLSVADIDLYLS